MGRIRNHLIALVAILLCGSPCAFSQGFAIGLHPYVIRAHCENGHWVITLYSVTEIMGVTLPGQTNQPVAPLEQSLLGIPTLHNYLKGAGFDDVIQLQNVTPMAQEITTIPTPIECDTSSDGRGGDLPNSNSSATPTGFYPTTGGLANVPEAAGREATASYTASYLFPFRSLPIAPIYAPNLVNNLKPCDVATNRNAFVVNHTSNTVTRLNTCNGQIVKVIPVGSRPLQVAITPDNSLALVTNFDNAISFIDTASNAVVQTLRTPDDNPSGIAITPDGAFAYVTSFNANAPRVLVVDIAKRQVVTSIPVGNLPQSIFLTPDGATAYVTFPLGGQVQLIDTLTNSTTSAINLASTFGVAFNSTGTLAYVTTQQAAPGRVAIINTATNDIIQNVPVGAGPTDIRVTADDAYILVNNYLDSSASIIDARTKQVQTFKVSGKPRGLVFVQ